MRKTLAIAGLAACILALAACSGHNSAKPIEVLSPAGSAASAGRSVLAQPTVSADITALENTLLANFAKELKAAPAHPLMAVHAAVRDTFPAGDTAAIEHHAENTFSPGVITSHPVRVAWAGDIITFALTQGGYTPPASPGAGTVPGATPSPSGA